MSEPQSSDATQDPSIVAETDDAATPGSIHRPQCSDCGKFLDGDGHECSVPDQCPHCGQFDIEGDHTCSIPDRCPDCGKFNPDADHVCSTPEQCSDCGYFLTDDHECPDVAWGNCPECSVAIRVSSDATPPVSVECPACQTEWRACPDCGGVMETAEPTGYQRRFICRGDPSCHTTAAEYNPE